MNDKENNWLEDRATPEEIKSAERFNRGLAITLFILGVLTIVIPLSL